MGLFAAADDITYNVNRQQQREMSKIDWGFFFFKNAQPFTMQKLIGFNTSERFGANTFFCHFCHCRFSILSKGLESVTKVSKICRV
jgi:hypothetical protein